MPTSHSGAAVESSAPAVTPHGLAAAIEQGWQAFMLADRRTPTPHERVYASAWRVCERRMVLELRCPEQQAPFDAFALARFRRGNDRERDLLHDLSRVGRTCTPAFEVYGQQERFEVKGRSGAVVISGKVDARIAIDREVSAPIEVKAWSPMIVDRIETFDDLFENPWTRSGGYQLLSYLFGSNQPFGFLLLDRSGLPMLLPVELNSDNLERMEEFLSRAERVTAHAKAGTLPDFLRDDAGECLRCSFYGTACNPPLEVQPTRVFTDPELEAALERWHTLRPAGKEWQGLDMDLKKQLRGVEHGIAGHFAITGTWSRSSKVDLPPELKKRYTVSDPKGRFSLEIVRQ